MKRVVVIIETDAEDSEGYDYPTPSTWHWEELVGGNATFLASYAKD